MLDGLVTPPHTHTSEASPLWTLLLGTRTYEQWEILGDRRWNSLWTGVCDSWFGGSTPFVAACSGGEEWQPLIFETQPQGKELVRSHHGFSHSPAAFKAEAGWTTLLVGSL